MTVLLVEDDEDQLAVRSALLRQSGFQTAEAVSVPAALQVLLSCESRDENHIGVCTPSSSKHMYAI